MSRARGPPLSFALGRIASAWIFVNCTIADNCGGERGGGLRLVNSPLVLANSIVWANVPSEIVVSGDGEPLVCYGDVLGGWPGPGNLDADPLFVRRSYWIDPDDPGVVLAPEDSLAVWVAGDYHLKSGNGRWDLETQSWVVDEMTSPCIDSGDPLDSAGCEPAPNGDIVNMGAYGGAAQAAKSL